MMKKTRIFSLLVLAAVVCLPVSAQRFVGMDLSLLPNYEIHNKPYLDKDGNAIDDMLVWLPNVGVNTVRARIFVNPQKKNQKGETDIQVCQNLDYVKAFGARVKAAGLNFMLDFHYSDTWADPVYQLLPAGWAGCVTAEQKAAKVYEYTKEVLAALIEAGATPDFVQVGNEISYGIVGIGVSPYDNPSSDWDGFSKVLENGCKAVREQCPAAKIVIHTERSGNLAQTQYFYQHLENLDYDIIGLSYYPFWHGSLDDLEAVVSMLATEFSEKKVQIVETAYNFNYKPDGMKYDFSSTWPYTEAGQKKFIEDLVAALDKHSNVNGVYYFFPEEAGNGDDSDWSHGGATVLGNWCNRGLWKPEVSGLGHKCNSGLYSLQNYVAGIDDIAAEVRKSQGIFNLSGMKITEPQPGEIYIQGGKKYLSK